jgi:hypothetical protein
MVIKLQTIYVNLVLKQINVPNPTLSPKSTVLAKSSGTLENSSPILSVKEFSRCR